jgi:hypothetical protein
MSGPSVSGLLPRGAKIGGSVSVRPNALPISRKHHRLHGQQGEWMAARWAAPMLPLQHFRGHCARESCKEDAVEPVELGVEIRKAAIRSAQAFAACVVALDCPRLYSPQQLFELKRLRCEADAQLMALEATQEPAETY